MKKRIKLKSGATIISMKYYDGEMVAEVLLLEAKDHYGFIYKVPEFSTVEDLSEWLKKECPPPPLTTTEKERAALSKTTFTTKAFGNITFQNMKEVKQVVAVLKKRHKIKKPKKDIEAILKEIRKK